MLVFCLLLYILNKAIFITLPTKMFSVNRSLINVINNPSSLKTPLKQHLKKKCSVFLELYCPVGCHYYS